MTAPNPMVVRVRFSKRGPIRFISHRDVARVWERAFRRARLPLAFTQGFSPHPKVSFGLALPLGYESDAEYVDLTLAVPRPPEEVASALNAVLPDGIAVEASSQVDAAAPSAASLASWAEYVVALSGPAETEPPAATTLRGALEELNTVREWSVPRRRKGQEVPGAQDDLRPRVKAIEVVDPPPEGLGPRALWMGLATQPRVVRPDEICDLLGALCPASACEARLVRRTWQHFVSDGRVVDPMGSTVPPASSTPAGRRHSPLGGSPVTREGLRIHAKVPSSS